VKDIEKRRGRKIKKEGTLAILNFRGFFHFFGSDNTLRMEKKDTRKRMLIRELKEWRWRENHILVM
jgi:hypothetical protein